MVTDPYHPRNARRSTPRDGAPASDTSQDDQGEVAGDEVYEALMFVDQFSPGARFVVVSTVVDWTPDVEEIRGIDPADYNTRVIRYLNVNQVHILFPAHDARIPRHDPELGYVVDDDEEFAEDETPHPEVYRLLDEATAVRFPQELMLRVHFTPLAEAEEADVLDDDDWWEQ